MKPRLFTPAEDARLIARYQAGWPIRRIAAELQRPSSSIAHRLRLLADLGKIQRRLTYKRPPPPLEGLTAEDLAWMAWWRQPPAVRRARAQGASL